MEDIIKALLDVVRAQHSATEGTDEAPFDMDDVLDMAMNLLGRPEEKGEEEAMVDEIQKMVESLAPDIFPPKTFEQMDDSEKVISAANMIENRLMRGNENSDRNPDRTADFSTSQESYSYGEAEEDEQEEPDVGDLNDLIYKNFMEMMGLSAPQVEYPFDRSQIVYGKEKSATEMLAEEEEERRRREEEDVQRDRKLSALELAQNVIDQDEAAHAKEEYVPKPIEQPVARSASQMANEAIRKAQEEDRMKLEIEKQAEALMAEARKRGQDPMDFMLHQQEILRYMEKNSDELVSFEDYEDLSPEEKLEIERQIHIDRQIAEGVDPDQVDTNVPEQYIPEGLKEQSPAPLPEKETTFDEDVLRALSQQVLSENSDMILSENENEDMVSLQEELFQNLKRMMNGSGTPVPQENVASLLSQAASNFMAGNDEDQEEAGEDSAPAMEEKEIPEETDHDTDKDAGSPVTPPAEEKPLFTRPMSAVELALAAQKGMKPGQEEEEQKKAEAELIEEIDLSFDEMDDLFEEDRPEEEPLEDIKPEEDEPPKEISGSEASGEEAEEGEPSADQVPGEEASEEEPSGDEPARDETGEEKSSEGENSLEESSEEDTIEEKIPEEDEYEYIDPDELVLGDHTQAEIDEAMANLSSLGLEGEVFERAKRMLLLELAGSEAVLDAWLKEQEQTGKKKADVPAFEEDSLDDLSDFDEDLFEKELDQAIDKDFEEKDSGDWENGKEKPEEIGEETGEEGTDEPEILDFRGDIEEVGYEEAEEIYTETDSDQGLEEIPEVSEEKNEEVEQKKTRIPRGNKGRKGVVHKREKTSRAEEEKTPTPQKETGAEERGYQISVRKPFILKNSTSFMDKLEDFITENQENRKLSTGFKKLDGLLRFGLHKGSYFIDAQPQFLKNAFMQQIADQAAESGVDVLYISTELSRYDLMVDSISRLSYEMNGHDPSKAHSVMSIMTGEEGAGLSQLSDELNWYRGRISEHLFILDQEAVDEFIDGMEEEASAGAILEELIRSIVTEGSHKPVVFIDNIENILSVEDSEDMKPLMDGIGKLAKELNIPIIMSYGYEQAENEQEMSYEEHLYHESLGNMCDVYLELKYADMITEDSVELTIDDIREMAEDGESLLFDVQIYRNRRPMRASCQIQGTPKFNFFEE